MRLNHLDILEQCFRDKFRGYNKQEVDMFLHLVADDFKEMSEEIERLKIKIAENDDLIEDLKNQSQAGSENVSEGSGITPEALKDKARQVMREVTEQADLQKKKALQELSGLKKEIEKLSRDKSSLIDNIKKSALEHFDQFKK
jgi:cell division initiation protein